MLNELAVDTSQWPKEANLTQWSRALPVSYATLIKYRALGRLPAKRALTGALKIDKRTIMRCFGIK